MNIKEELRELAFANDMNYFGVAPAERLSNLPEGHRPTDLLPGAKSVVVLGIRVPENAIRANELAFTGGQRHAIFSYILFGYNKINDQLDLAALRTVFKLEKQYGSSAYAIPASGPRDEYLLMSAMSNRYAAVCAGLGDFGWSGFVVTPVDGPRVRWISIITTAEIEPDALYAGPKLCDTEKCEICVESCPVGALSLKEAVTAQIEDKTYHYAQRNKPLCRCATAGLVEGTPGRLQAEVPTEMNSMEDWLKFTRKDSPWQRMEATRGNYCHRCLIVCPIGRS